MVWQCHPSGSILGQSGECSRQAGGGGTVQHPRDEGEGSRKGQEKVLHHNSDLTPVTSKRGMSQDG